MDWDEFKGLEKILAKAKIRSAALSQNFHHYPAFPHHNIGCLWFHSYKMCDNAIPILEKAGYTIINGRENGGTNNAFYKFVLSVTKY